MKVSVNWVDFEIEIDRIEKISFYYDSKRHKWIAYLNYGMGEKFEISEKKGEAIIEFLKWLSQEAKKLSTPGNEENFDMVHDEGIFDRALSKESSSIGPGDEENFDFQGEDL